MHKLLVLQVAALGYHFLRANNGERLAGLPVRPLKPVFPAVTCTAQATLRTATLPTGHGIVGNGFFFPDLRKPLFWEQNGRLIEQPFIWESFRKRGGTVAQLFIQQSLGTASDIILSPAPIHKHHGGMIMDCYALPATLNARLRATLGNFPLHRYWGPLASAASSRWIVAAIEDILANEAPGLVYAYLPHLDYALQKHGPDAPRSRQSLKIVLMMIDHLVAAARNAGYETVLFGDYPITAARQVVFPNRLLHEAGLLVTREITGMRYPDFHRSSAFAVVDHQIAHVHIWNPAAAEKTRALLAALPGVAAVLDEDGKRKAGIAHRRSGDVVLVADRGAWFDYRWWHTPAEAPDYATHVDIHNKPGYDPCELFFGWPPPATGQNPCRIKGTHGRCDDDEPTAFASSLDLPGDTTTLAGLAASIRMFLESPA